jgi:hypothetical protein
MACSNSKTCTLIGCNDQFTIQIQLADGARPHLTADMVIDGRAVSCAAPTDSSTVTCDTGVSVWSRELQSCTQSQSGTVVMETCVGSGVFAETIVVQGSPKSLSMSLLNGTTSVAQQTFQPQYESNQPNGPGCDPICKQAATTWTVP